MITKVNPYGHISLTNDYFSGLVEQAAKQCYGIAAMGQAPAESVVRNALRTGSRPAEDSFSSIYSYRSPCISRSGSV